jgi:nucleoside-diphosphate-sugar epimerase
LPAADLEHILTHTDSLWRELTGSRIFITGGTGFFGIWLLESIAAANDRLKVGVGATVLSRDPQPFLARMPHLARRPEFDWLCGHPATFSFPKTRHEYLLHLATATSAHLERTDPIEMLKAKLFGISHVLDYARYAGIRRMLVTSSGAVYGPQPAELSHIPETYRGGPDPMNAASAYGEGKRLVEQMCSLVPEVDTVVARCFSFIGPHLPLDARFAVGNFLRDAIAGEQIAVQGEGTAVRSLLHAADLTIWLLAMLVRGRPGRAYNAGSDEAVTIAELAQRVAAVAPGKPVVRILGTPSDRVGSRYVPDIALAQSELGLVPRVHLDDAITRTLAWYLNAGESKCGTSRDRQAS